MGEHIVTSASRGFRFVRFLMRLMLRSQYRAIEVEGADCVPDEGPVLLVANHNSGLVDPMALLHASPRPASFLAKAPLWNVRLLAPFLNAVGAIPVYRPEDEGENAGRTARANVETFRRCRKRLASGGSIALFPEGVSHPQPQVLPLRTGAARIALDAGVPVTVCPVGLVYGTTGADRRGTLLIVFGEPFVVDGWKPYGSRRGAITTVTRRLEEELGDLLAQASSQSELAELRAMRVVWEQEEGDAPPDTLVEAHERDRMFARALARMRKARPGDIEKLRADADEWMRALELAGIPPERVGTVYDRRRVLRFLLVRAPLLLLGAPFGLVAGLLTWPQREFGDLLALRMLGGTEDLRALCRMLGGGLVLILLMLGGTLVGLLLRSWWIVVAAVVGLPALLTFYIVWRDFRRDTFDRIRSFLLLAGSQLHETLLEHRHELHDRLSEAWALLGETDGEGDRTPED